MSLPHVTLAQGSPRMSRDSGVSPGWGSASAGALQPPPPVTSTPEVKRAGPAAKEPREPKKVAPHPAGQGAAPSAALVPEARRGESV